MIMENNYQIEKGQRLAKRLTKGFVRHGYSVKVKKKFVIHGTQYIFEVKPMGKTRYSNLYDCLNDVRRRLGLRQLHIVEKDPKIFIVASEHGATDNYAIDILNSPQFADAKRNMEIPIIIGRDVTGKITIVDLRELPHLIIGGATKMGKTVAFWCQLLSILICCPPEKVKLLIYDGGSSLTMFNGFPHLLRPVIQNPSVGYEEILGLERLMEQRLEQKTSVSHRFYPIIICYIDEFSLLVNGRDKEEAKKFATAISRLTRSGRNADIHLIMAIHNPVKDSIGGCDLNAVTARMAFMCSSTHQSVALIGNDDAKTLVRKGEMLFRLSEDELFHLQGANITPQELERVLNHVRSYWERYENNDPIKGQPLDITESINTLHEDKMTASDQIYTQQSPITLDHGFTVSIAKPKLSDKDKMFTEVVIWTLEQETISCRMIERQFKVGYGKASDILERLHKAGIVSEGHGKLPRKVLVDKIEDLSSEITDLLCLAGYATEDVADTSTPKADTNNVTTS